MDESKRKALKTLLGVGAISSLLGASILTTELLTQRHVEVVEQIINRTIVERPINQTQVTQQLQQYNTYTTNYWDADAVVYTKDGNYYAVSHDGTTICTGSPTACIQEAVNYVTQFGGGRIFIRRSTYPVSRTITVSGNNIEIVGDYPTILGSPDFTFPILRIYKASNVRVKGLIIDMQADWNTTRTTYASANNIQVADSSDVEIAYNILKNARDFNVYIGVYTDGSIWVARPCDRVWVHHNLVSGGRADGIDVTATKHIIIENNIVTGTGDDAIAILAWMDYPVEDVIIRSNIIYKHRYSCFKLAHYYAPTGSYAMNNIIIEGNYCETTVDEGGGAIAIQYESPQVPPDGIGRNIYVLNNIIYTGNVRWHAIAIWWFQNPAPNYTYKNIVIRGNYISAVNDPLDFSTSPPTLKNLFGIWVKVNTKVNGLVIENNVIERFRKAIALQDNNSAIIRNNVFKYNFEQAVLLWKASGVEISNNYIYDNARYRLYDSNWAPNVVFIYNASDIVVARNTFRAGKTQTSCIGIFSSSSNIYIVDNDMFNGYLITPVSDDGTNTNVVFKRNRGYATKTSGVATFSGDGTTTQFKIPHGLVKGPSKVLATPASKDASGSFYVTADSTYIYVNYFTAPPTGTNNVVLYWYAEV